MNFLLVEFPCNMYIFRQIDKQPRIKDKHENATINYLKLLGTKFKETFQSSEISPENVNYSL